MSNETIADLRTSLFAAMRGLTDKENPIDIERARAVSDIAQTIVNTAKVEIDFLRVSGGKGSGFIPDQNAQPALPDGTTVVDKKPGVTVTRHTLKG